MKKKIFIAIAFIAVSNVASPLYAQEAATQKTKTKGNQTNERASWDLAKGTKCRVSTSPIGCDIVFENEVKSPRDAASGQASGKRQHKPFNFSVSSSDNSVTEITSPRDVATGQSTGKRSPGNPIGGLSIKGGKNPGGNQFNKIVAQDGEFTLPADLPDGEYTIVLSWSWGETNAGSMKRCSTGFTVTMEGGTCMAISTKGAPATKSN